MSEFDLTQHDPYPQNSRGEYFDVQLRLFNDPGRGETWAKYAEATLPIGVFKELGLLGSERSGEMVNVLEHSMAVTAGAVTLANELKAMGIPVDVATVERAAWVHDAGKAFDLRKKMSREAEVYDEDMEHVLRRHGYSPQEIAAAKNTGRLWDRFKDGDERTQAIEGRSIEENIVGYVDARTRGAHLAPLEVALGDSVEKKPKDEAFFREHWMPYYEAVEQYFDTRVKEQSESFAFDPYVLNDESSYWTVEESVATR